MYTGQSVGRLIAWLRELIPSRMADQVQFGYEDGSIRWGGETVIRSVQWDEHDTPTFDFVEDSYNASQERLKSKVLHSEYVRIHYTLESSEWLTLMELDKEPYVAEQARMKDCPAALRSLLKKRLVQKTESSPGWDEDGNFVCDLLIEITAQSRGFLDYLSTQEVEVS